MLQKTCQIHGALEEKNIYEENLKYKTLEGMKISKQLRCRLCKREKDINYKKLNRKKLTEYSINWKKQNIEHYRKWLQEDRAKNPEKHKEYARRGREKLGKLRSIRESCNLRGISVNDYNRMAEKQDNKCAICFEPERRKSRTGDIARLCIDHDHETQKVRSLLCHDCNTGLGKFHDSQELLAIAAAYLSLHSGTDETK